MKPETAAKLDAAARLVRTAAEQLDRREQPCDHCGTNRKLNWTEWQMAQELDAMVRKLRNFAKKLAAPTEADIQVTPAAAAELKRRGLTVKDVLEKF